MLNNILPATGKLLDLHSFRAERIPGAPGLADKVTKPQCEHVQVSGEFNAVCVHTPKLFSQTV